MHQQKLPFLCCVHITFFGIADRQTEDDTVEDFTGANVK